MINTYKESSLHKTLKEIYAGKTNGKTEVEADGHIYDIVSQDESVIEIQTKNLGQLKTKLTDSLNKGRIITVVHPIAERKTITTLDKSGSIISKRKSPKKGSLYSIFDELKGIYSLLLRQNFYLEVLIVNITEVRIKTDTPEQSENKRRRFKKNWQKADKKLEEIIETFSFNNKEDYLKLLPELPEEFTVKDIKNGLEKDISRPENASKYGNLIAWTFCHMNLFEMTGKKGNAKIYRLKN